MFSTIKQSAMRIAGQAVVVTALLGAGGAQAAYAPLNLAAGTPDIVSSFITTSYDEGTATLTASGFALSVRLSDGSARSIAGGSFNILASLDAASINSGSLSIGGTIAGLGYISGTLLEGSLQQLGAPLSGEPDTLEFLFAVTGGDAAGMFGSTVGVILGDSSYNGGDFLTGFVSTRVGSADTFGHQVPLPGAIWLMLSALATLFAGQRRKVAMAA